MPKELSSEPVRKRLANGSLVNKPYIFGSPNISQFVEILTQVGTAPIKVLHYYYYYYYRYSGVPLTQTLIAQNNNNGHFIYGAPCLLKHTIALGVHSSKCDHTSQWNNQHTHTYYTHTHYTHTLYTHT